MNSHVARRKCQYRNSHIWRTLSVTLTSAYCAKTNDIRVILPASLSVVCTVSLLKFRPSKSGIYKAFCNPQDNVSYGVSKNCFQPLPATYLGSNQLIGRFEQFATMLSHIYKRMLVITRNFMSIRNVTHHGHQQNMIS